MSADQKSGDSIKSPKRGRLLLAGAVFVAAGGAIVVNGISSRAQGQQKLAQWTDAQAVPSVALAKIEHGAAEENLDLPGTIQPYNHALINARVSGYLAGWQQDIGAHVQAGQALATIETPDLDQQFDQAKADLATAIANEKLAALTATRWKALLSSQSVAQQAVDEKLSDAVAKQTIVDAAQANLRRLAAMENFKTVVAPFTGVVTARNVDIGTLINAGSSAGQDLFEVSDLSKLRIYVQVPQSVSARITPGLKATFEVPQYPGQQFAATLVTTSQAMNMASRTMLVQLQADNPGEKLAAGTYAEVHFKVPGDPTVLRVPATALVVGLHGMQLAVLGADHSVRMQPIKVGRDLGDSVEVIAGLSPADHVIDSPPETLAAGDLVRLADAGPTTTKVAAATPPAPKVD
ncbi:MAG TPA: efflux RND transporter periplasmic adaptor subunit [Acetobacteraceae bacterium]|jgi:RND family efflux transporter MFP subunit